MKELKKEDLQITELIHHFVREHVEAGDICIDATAGCGNDTLFLCELTGARGEVMATILAAGSWRKDGNAACRA